jgi:dual specificity phosphatase 12
MSIFSISILSLILYILTKPTCSYFNNNSNNSNNSNNMDEIVPGLWIGNMVAANDLHSLKKNNIKYIFNISRDIPNYYEIDNNFEYYNFQVDDSLLIKDIDLMTQNLNILVNELDTRLRKKNGSILVHCYAGRQRSAILVAAYLVFKYNMTPEDACQYILTRRPEAFHYNTSINFKDSLQKYYLLINNDKSK